MALNLHVIVCSTRPGRVGARVGRWFADFAADQSSFETRLVDLSEVDLPLFNESRHPKLGNYEHEHTRRWAAIVGEADAYAFVAPEYNHGPTPALVNALSYLAAEWALKPAGFVSYGGRSGGLRAVQLTKTILSALKMYPTKNGVVVPSVNKHIQGELFVASDSHQKEAAGLLAELHELSGPLAALRASKA